MINAETIQALRDRIKFEGFSAVVVGLMNRISRNEQDIKDIGADLGKVFRLLISTQNDVYQRAVDIVRSEIRSEEGLKLVEFKNRDVYAVNKHIERLEREIAEIRSLLNS